MMVSGVFIPTYLLVACAALGLIARQLSDGICRWGGGRNAVGSKAIHNITYMLSSNYLSIDLHVFSMTRDGEQRKNIKRNPI
ncbi:hypothetical protein F5X99DRAFT_370106 [Biscogniauxia marginata]|nr:hypothetical protein F5X99DRAFT_370106 [Biscogniauxia marginata]